MAGAKASFRTRHLGRTVKLLGRDYATLAEAATDADLGDTIAIPPGLYDVGSSALTWPTGVHMIGLGHWRDTAITGSSAQATVAGLLGRQRFENIHFLNTSTVASEDLGFAGNMGSALSITGTGVPDWQANTEYAKNAIVKDSSTLAAVALVAGTSGETAPEWTSYSDGQTVVDGDITWLVVYTETTHDDYISNCAFSSDTGSGLSSSCGHRQIVQNCYFKKWGRWGVQGATGAYESSQTPPKHGLCLFDCVAENHMTLPAWVAGQPVGFARLVDRILILKNCQITMSCAADLGTGGVPGMVVGAYRYTGQILKASGNDIMIVGAANNNAVIGFANRWSRNTLSEYNMELRNNVVIGVTSHASGVQHFKDLATGFGGASWFISGGNVTYTNWSVTSQPTPIVDAGGLAFGVEKFAIADLAANASLSATTCLKLTKAATLFRCLLFMQGTPVGVDNSNTVVVTLKDGAGNTIVAKTFNGTNPLIANQWNDLGTLNVTHKVLTADEVVTVEIAQGTTADIPASVLMLQYQ